MNTRKSSEYFGSVQMIKYLLIPFGMHAFPNNANPTTCAVVIQIKSLLYDVSMMGKRSECIRGD